MKRQIWCGLMAAWLCGNAFAGPFTLPFSDPNTPIWQGFYYNVLVNGSYYHGAIDYGINTGTPVLAPADGYAWTWSDDIYSTYSWGNYVAIYHPSCDCYTLSAHLNQVETFIPRVYKATHGGGTYVSVKRGQRIGWSGMTGTEVPHLHFEVTVGGINGAPGAYRVDPYGLFDKNWAYPGCGNNGGNYLYWSQCPPITATAIPSCTSPGTYVDISKPGDFDGNHKFEFVRFYNAPGRWDVALSNGADFVSLRQWTCGLGINSVAQLVGDMNGDGRDDSCIVDLNSNGNVYVGISTGSKFNDFYQAGSNLMKNMTNRFFVDVNGDGKDDLVGYNGTNGNWYVSLSNGFTFGPQFYSNLNYGLNSTKRMMADVNGDGRTDVVIFYASTGTWVVALGQSNGTFAALRNWETDHGKGASDWFVADINGDHRADAICYWNNVAPEWQGKIIIHESTGSSFAGTDTPRAIGHGTGSSRQMFGDFTGDGKADFAFWFPSTGWWVSRCDGWGFLSPTQW